MWKISEITNFEAQFAVCQETNSSIDFVTEQVRRLIYFFTRIFRDKNPLQR